MKTVLEQLQEEFRQEAEKLATLQSIYAERVRQIRTNRNLPPDIQERFLTEWEQFYNQHVSDIFNYTGSYYGDSDYQLTPDRSESAGVNDSDPSSQEFGIETVERRPQKKNRS
jgi:hypothetical protein